MSSTNRDIALIATMGNLSSRTSGKGDPDEAKQLFKTGTANKLIVPEYHNGWTLANY